MKTKENRCVVVTGGSGGLGYQIARRFREAGDVVVVADTDWRVGRQLRKRIGAHFVNTDVCSYKACVALALKAAEFSVNGGIDVVVANAGFNEGRSTKTIGITGWDESIALNLSGVFKTVRATFDLLNPGATVEIVSSLVGVVGQFPGSAYVAAKGGLIAYGKALALELVPKGATVKVICPHAINTPMLYRWAQKQPEGEAKAIRKLKATLPFGELFEPADIAEWAFFLASPSAAIMTGQSLVLDGGASLGC